MQKHSLAAMLLRLTYVITERTFFSRPPFAGGAVFRQNEVGRSIAVTLHEVDRVTRAREKYKYEMGTLDISRRRRRLSLDSPVDIDAAGRRTR